MIKLPNADYDGVVEGSVTKAIRRYMSRQILIGDGTSGKFKGIFHNPTETKDQVIDPATDLSMTAVDDGTLDEIIYSFGGDEDVEDAAVLVLNKKDLKAFAKLRDKQGRKVYTIVNHGNTGTIDGVPYVINSACGAVTDAQTKAIVYCMAYGPLSNYEMAIFSDIDARKSLDYKFKQGQIAYPRGHFRGRCRSGPQWLHQSKTPGVSVSNNRKGGFFMTIDELKAAAKLRTRKMSTDELDEDVFRYVDFALADLKRIGVAEEYLKAPEDPLIIEAVLTYVKANYSMDANHERLMNSYNMILTKKKGGEYRSTQ